MKTSNIVGILSLVIFALSLIACVKGYMLVWGFSVIAGMIGLVLVILLEILDELMEKQ